MIIMNQKENEEKENLKEKGIIILENLIVLKGNVIEGREVVQGKESLFVILILDLIELMVKDYRQENRQVS